MDKKILVKYKENGSRIKINLKNNMFYTGCIIEVYDDSVLFKDKFSDEIPINIDSISYIIPASKGGKND